MRRLIPVLFVCTLLAACAGQPSKSDLVTISVVGFNDVHGQLFADGERRGFVSVAAYVEALRNLRKLDGGEVLIIDAGDMWQGTLESNLNEGAPMIEIYNALGVAAAAIGNHEFDFGPLGPDPIPMHPGQDPRGALKQRAREAEFPLLAANLIDEATGKPVAWDNVYPSVMLDVGGLSIGVIGVMSVNSLHATIAANTTGLHVAPLEKAIVREATLLRDSGAQLVIVTAHAGARCTAFEDPDDTSACNMNGEIMRVAKALPRGLVDHIVGGHVHEGIAHIVNDISITSSFSSTRAFGRTDFTLDRRTGAVVARRVFPPQYPAATLNESYENQPLAAPANVVAIADRAIGIAEARKREKLGVTLDEPFELIPDVESALFNLMTEAMLDSFDADIAIHNVFGGIRSGLPAGELTFGDIYLMFPFDNVVTIHEITGAQLRAVIGRQARSHRKPGFAGMQVFVSCGAGGMDIVMRRNDGREIEDADSIRLVANDFLALGGDDILTPVLFEQKLEIKEDMPRTRDALLDWLRARPGVLERDTMRTHQDAKWNVPDAFPVNCTLQASR